MRTPSSDRDAAITSWPPTRSYCGQSTGADAQGGATSGLPAIHPAATSNRTQVSAQVSQPCVPRPRAEKERTRALIGVPRRNGEMFSVELGNVSPPNPARTVSGFQRGVTTP